MLTTITNRPKRSLAAHCSLDARKPAGSFDHTRRQFLREGTGLALAAALGILPRLALANDLKIGAKAPPLVLHALDGRSIATTDLINQVVVVTFWATWCIPCHVELPLLSNYVQSHSEDGIQALGFSLDSKENLVEVRSFASTLHFPTGLLESQYAAGYGRIWRLPVSFVIDRAGRLADNGWEDDEPGWTERRLHQTLDPLLSRPG